GGLPIDTITADLNVNLDPVEAVVGDIDLPIDLNLDLSGVNLGDVTGAIGGATGTIGGVTGALGSATGTLGDLGNLLTGDPSSGGTTSPDTDLTLNLDAVLPGGLPIDTITADLNVNLDPVEAVVGDIDLPIDVNLDLSGINLGDVTGAIGGATGALGGVTGALGSATGALGDLGNLLTGDASSGGTTSPDTDLTLNLDAVLPGGLPIDTITADLNVNLDPVEAVVGDIDLPIDANLDLSGVNLGDVTGAIGGATGALGGVTGALGSATGALGDLGNLLTGDPSSGGTTSPDTDLTLNLDAVLPGGLPIDTITADLNVNLDPVEAVVGDIDLPIDVNLDLSGINLGDVTGAIGGATGALGGVTGALGSATGALGDLGNLLTGDASSGGTTSPDTDLTLNLDAVLPGGLPIDTITADLNVNLDPVEAVVGDIDLPIDANLDLSGVNLGDVTGAIGGATGALGGVTGALGSATGTLGDLGNLLTGDPSSGGTTSPDTDLTLNLDAVLPGGLPIDTVTADLNVNLDPVEAVVGDIDLPIDVNLDLSGINLGDVTGAIGGATGALGGVTGALGSATGALGDLGNLLTGDPSSGGTTSPDTDLTLNLDAVLPGGLPIDTITADLNVNLDPVEAVVGDIDLPIDVNLDLSGVNLGDVTGAIGGATGALGGVTGALGSATGALGDLGNLLTGDPSSGGTTSPDTDLTLNLDAALPGGLPIDTVTADLGVNLDPVEAVVGDIDLPIDVNLDLSGVNLGDVTGAIGGATGALGGVTGALGSATGALGDLGNLLTGDPSSGGTTSPDTDLSIHLDAALPGGLPVDTVTADLGVNLDPIEAVVGDIDLPIDANLDLSGMNLGSISGTLGDASSALGDTTAVLSGATSTLGNITGALGGVTGTVSDTTSTLGGTGGAVSDLTAAGSHTVENLALNLDTALAPVGAAIGEIDPQLGANLDYDTSLSLHPDLVSFITETTQATVSPIASGTTESQSIYDLLTAPVSLLTTSVSGGEQTSALSSLVADTSTTHVLDSTTLDTTTHGSDVLSGGLLTPISNIIVGTTSDSSLSSALSSTTSSATTSSTSGLLTQSGTSTTGSELLHLDASLSTTSNLSSGLTSSLSSTVQSLTTTANLSLDAATTTTSSITSSATTSTTATTSAIASTSASTSHATAGAGLTSLIGAVKTTTTSLLGGWHK
ncbi:hypothetical protein LOC51_22095, partial [Rubrivivax sp. JA1024]|nr:hypothetical protein [Rubrivivax sp. JA1024]